mmetsp:Transcript_99722/g.171752  ORF Transcript_99722/g.171752 Transcript_99722/m.171752 type:complete len:1098 (-) Transcript_99722:32-3325(-)
MAIMESMAQALGDKLMASLECMLNERALKLLRNGSPGKPFGIPNVDVEYLEHVEASFLLKYQYNTLRKSLHPTMLFCDETGRQPTEDKVATIKQLLTGVGNAMQHLRSLTEARLQVTNPKPRVIRLCERMGLQKKEEQLALLFVLLINAGVELPTYAGVRPTCAFMASYSEMDHHTYLHFLSEERPHLKQGLVCMSDTRFKTTLSECTLKMSREVLAALSNAAMTEAEMLKLDKSALAEVLAAEASQALDSRTTGGVAASQDPAKQDEAGSGSDTSEDEGDRGGMDSFDLYDYIREQKSDGATVAPVAPTATCSEVDSMPTSKKRKRQVDLPSSPIASTEALEELFGAPAVVGNGEGPATDPTEDTANSSHSLAVISGRSKLQAYTTDLEYLADVFRLLSVLIKIRNAEADIKDDDPEYVLQPKTEAEALLRELKGKERVQKMYIDKRLTRTQQAGKWLPRIELLVQRRGLTLFEKLVLLFLVGSVISHDILIAMNSKYVMRGEDKRDRTVGYLLYILCDTLPQRVANRSRFYKSATLVKDGMVTVSDKPAFGDLMDCPVDVDRRMLDYLVGLDSEFNEIVEGSHLYAPKVSLSQVILPAEQKALVMASVSNFDTFTSAKKKFGMEDIVSYGGGLVLLFHGASGTGKTMLANAIATELKKKLLLVNLASMLSGGKGGAGDVLKLIFREAKLYDALIFFDECESFFESRTKSPLVTSMLAELERYSGLIVMATNKAYVMDEAMHRRITLAIEFKNPDHTMRRDIWAKHVAPSIPLKEDVDFDALALDYELSGGLIKNAILSALSIAVSRDGPHPVLSMDDFRQGAKMQLRSFFREEAFARKVVPKRSLADCVFHDATREALQQIVALEKGRKLLYTHWGFEEDECTRQSIVALFTGPTGTGKSLAAEVIGYETGATLKVVNVAEIGAKPSGDATVEKVFEDAVKQNALLVLDDAERLFQSGGGADDISQLLAYHMAHFARPVIIIARTGAYLDTLNTPFNFNFKVQFPLPSLAHRARLWRQAIPTQVPLEADVTFTELAEQELTGAQIKAIAFFACAKASVLPAVRTGAARIGRKLLEDSIAEVQSMSKSRTLSALFS